MRHVSEVERFDRDFGDDAGVCRLVRWVRAALVVYLIPVLIVVLGIGMVAIVLQATFTLLVRAALAFRLRHDRDECPASEVGAFPQSLFPGERFNSRNEGRCGRYVPILGNVGEPSWSVSPMTSLH